jgi:hypothetical protein
MRAPGRDVEPARAGVGGERELGALGQLAHDLVQQVRRRRHRALLLGRDGDVLDDLDVEIGGADRQPLGLGLDQHVAEDRDGVLALDDALGVAHRAEECAALDRDLHRLNPSLGGAAKRARWLAGKPH